MFQRFGSAVTVVQYGKQLLGREDPDVAAEVYKLLETDGIEILLETEAVGVHASAAGVGLVLRGPAGETVTLPTILSPGETCRLEYRGGSWSAINGGKTVIAAGSAARIERVDGLTLVVHDVKSP